MPRPGASRNVSRAAVERLVAEDREADRLLGIGRDAKLLWTSHRPARTRRSEVPG